MNDHLANVAVARVLEPTPSYEQKQPKKPKKHKLTSLEKALYLLSVFFVTILVSVVILQAAFMNKLNHNLANIEQQIGQSKRLNQTVQVNFRSLSDPMVMEKYAKENGFYKKQSSVANMNLSSAPL